MGTNTQCSPSAPYRSRQASSASIGVIRRRNEFAGRYSIRTLLLTALLFAFSSLAAFAQSPEFSEPWKNPTIALAIDPFEGNEIDWEKLATDTRVVAIIHRATIGDRADRKYVERRDEAKKRGYKWGAYHFGKPGDPVKQADFFLETVKPAVDDLIALDLESEDATQHMSFDEARSFIKRIKEKTGRYPLIYANNLVKIGRAHV